MQARRGKQARRRRFGGTRRNACTSSRRLITRRSHVQILPRYCERPWKRGLSLLSQLPGSTCHVLHVRGENPDAIRSSGPSPKHGFRLDETMGSAARAALFARLVPPTAREPEEGATHREDH